MKKIEMHIDVKNIFGGSVKILRKSFFVFLSIMVSSCYHSVAAQKKKASFSVIPLGVKGGLDESNLSAYLVRGAGTNNYVCLDAGTIHFGIDKALKNGALKGSVSSVLKKYIKAYLISHPHLDHVSGLIINSPDDTAKNIYALPFVINTLKEKYFTWQAWANFADAGESPQLKKYHYALLEEGTEQALENTDMSVTAFPLSHSAPGESTAFLLKNANDYILYLGDTGPDSLEKSTRLFTLWQRVAPLIKTKQLKAIFIEVSFLNEQPDSQLFGHLTPKWLIHEMTALGKQTGSMALKNFPIIVTHSKLFDSEEEKLKKQLEQQNKLQLKLIYPKQGLPIQF